MTDTALLLIDIQNDYFPGGAMECRDSLSAGKNAENILAFARKNEILPIHIRHISTRPGASFFLPGTLGSEISPLVSPGEQEEVIVKHFPNSFRNTDLSAILQESGITTLVIAGMMTHMCIDATTRAAADLGYRCILVHDACATRDQVFLEETIPARMVHASFIAALSGMYAKIVPTEEMITGIDGLIHK
ncbi:MAG: cysteine hydrolase [Methanospirillum sp.]|nr:cysteine hydrolase [Methanospirillum sp.]